MMYIMDSLFTSQKNRYGAYSLRTMHNEEDQKVVAALRLMSDLNDGVRSGEEEGWSSDHDLDRHFHERRKK